MNRVRKKLEVQMKNRTFDGNDQITVLGFLAKFRDACDINHLSEGVAMWCFQFFLSGQAEALLQSRLAGGSMAVDVEQEDLLRTYPQVVNFLLRTYATDEIIAEAYSDVMSFKQTSAMTEEQYSNLLWERALRC